MAGTGAFRRGERVPVWLAVLLGLFAAIDPISTDIYLPALPEIERTLRAAPGSGGAMMAAWLTGLAGGQIALGPLSDRFGRRLPLVLGMGGYTLAEAGCALAPTMGFLCLCRALAAFAASAAMVVPAACARDMTEGEGIARLLSRLMAVQGIAIACAPVLGGLAAGPVGWRGVFWGTSAYGAACAALAWRVLPETLPREDRRALHPRAVLRTYGAILRMRSFHANALVFSFLVFAIFAYLTGVPALFEGGLGLSPAACGMVFGVVATVMIVVAWGNERLVEKLDPSRMLRFALRAGFAGSLVFLAVALAAAARAAPDGRIPAGFLAPLIAGLLLARMPDGLVFPNAMALALSEQAACAGSASALAGTMEYLAGAAGSALTDFLPGAGAVPMAGSFLLAVLAASACARLLRADRR